MALSNNARRLILKVKNESTTRTRAKKVTIGEMQSQCSFHLVIKSCDGRLILFPCCVET